MVRAAPRARTTTSPPTSRRRYNPWDQRLCLVPDADLFEAIKAGKAEVVTDHIDRFTPTGIRLKSGARAAADIVVTATGLDMQMLSGVAITVDGERVDLGQDAAPTRA